MKTLLVLSVLFLSACQPPVDRKAPLLPAPPAKPALRDMSARLVEIQKEIEKLNGHILAYRECVYREDNCERLKR